MSAAAKKEEGNTYFKNKDYEKAIKAYSEAIALDSNDKTFYSNRSAAYTALNKFEEAAQDGLNCIRCDKYWVKGYHRTATAQVALNKYVDAMKTVEEGLKTNGDHPDLKALKDEIMPQYEKEMKNLASKMSKEERLKEEGNVFFKKSAFEEAIAKYTDAINLMPHEYGKPLNPIAVSCYNNRAACYQQLGFYKKVTEDSSIVIEADPKNVKALLRRGLALEALEKYRSALNDIREVLAIDPTIEMANKAQHRIGQAVRQLKSGGDM